jgi:TonB dependent receptor/CarboxypepD_reg-like domain/TonB-dependent Receptor Plug Domain
MKLILRKIRWVVWFILLFNCTRAQDTLFKNIHFKAAEFKTVIQLIENQSQYTVYYNSNIIETYQFTYEVDSIGMHQLLQHILFETNFNAAIDTYNKSIYISNTNAIKTTLAPNFWVEASQTILPFNNELIAPQITKNNIKALDNNRTYTIGNSVNTTKNWVQLTGYVKDSKNGEPIYGATISIDSSNLTFITDQFGYYSIKIKKGKSAITISSVGMKESRRQLNVLGDGNLDIDMQDAIVSLKSVLVVSEKKSNVKSVQMGVAKLGIKSIKQVPVLFGEADIIKVVMALPGVTSVGEASAGFNVRGGSTDQNLILFNEATIYNPTHLFGFFSAFNADIVKGIELYKSAVPEKFGGRLSSVLDVSVRDGNTKKFTGNIGIGPLTSKFVVEGPLVKNKASIIISGRTTYSNWLLQNLKNIAYNNSKANFYDYNIHITNNINPKNTLYVSGYVSNDKFTLNADTLFSYSNANFTVKWKHVFNNKLNAFFVVGNDNYKYNISSTAVPINGYKLGFGIQQNNVKAEFKYNYNNTHAFNFGLQSILYTINTGYLKPEGNPSLVKQKIIPKEQAFETAIYLGDQININPKLSVTLGIRYSLYNYLANKDVYQYAAGLPKSVNTIIDTVQYAKGKNLQTYHGPEIRLALRYSLTEKTALKCSFNTFRQYIHLLSNTTSISPTDTWKLSDNYIKPQLGQQFSIGLYKNLKSGIIETSLEVYYKTMQQIIDYKSGAAILLNNHIETELINTKGRAYGIECSIKKTAGKLNGWISYTYARTFLQQADNLAGETINYGQYYPTSFDKPHSVNVIANYRFSHRYSMSANFVYSTGRPITLPLAVFTLGGAASLYYSDRNQYRIPDYIRGDISINIDGNHKVKQKIHNSWSVGVYNIGARQNAYSVYFINENGKINGYQLSIFGTAIPFVTYNIKF